MVHLIQAAILLPIAHHLEICGQSPSRLYRRAELVKFISADQDHYLPLHLFMSFIDHLDRVEGINPFLRYYNNYFEEDHLSRAMRYTFAAPDLLSCIFRVIRANSTILTNETFSMSVCGSKATIRSHMKDISPRAMRHVTALSIMLLIDTIRAYTGNAWEPEVIAAPPDVLDLLDDVFECRSTGTTSKAEGYTILLDASYLYDSCSHGREIHDEDVAGPNISLDTVESRILRLLEENHDPCLPTFHELCDYVGRNPRTMSRRMAEEGLTYGGIISKWRLQTIVRLMKMPDVSIRDISERIGYTDIANFYRAFRRWFGTTPGQYRSEIS